MRNEMKDILKGFRFASDGTTTLADALCNFIKEEIAFGPPPIILP